MNSEPHTLSTAPHDEPRGPIERRLIVVIGVLLGVTTLALVVRAVTLKVAYYDEVDNFHNALALLGDPLSHYYAARAPLAVIAQLPAMGLRRLGLIMDALTVPHLIALVVTLAALFACFRLNRVATGITAALLATLLLLWNRLVLHYAPFADNTGPSLLAVAFGLLAVHHARRRPSRRNVVLAGIAAGLVGLARWQLLLFGPAVALFWIAAPWLVRADDGADDATADERPHGARIGDLLLLAVVAVVVFNSVHATADVLLGTIDALTPVAGFHNAVDIIGDSGTARIEAHRTAGPTFYLEVLPAICGWGTIAICLVGVVIAGRRRHALDVFVLLWTLVCLVGNSAFPWYETRYIAPLLPAVAYFSANCLQLLIDAIRRSPRRAVPIGALLLVVGATGLNAAFEVVRWGDPVFRRDGIGALATQIESLRRPGARVFWHGDFHAFYPEDPVLHPDDPYYSIFHVGAKQLGYALDDTVYRVVRRDGKTLEDAIAELEDGSVHVVVREMIITSTLPDVPQQSSVIRVNKVVVPLDGPQPDGYRLTQRGDGLLLQTREAPGPRILVGRRADGGVKVLGKGGFDKPLALPIEGAFREIHLAEIELHPFE